VIYLNKATLTVIYELHPEVI